ncbi:hypothetical protein [Chitinophaga agri]|uniref:Uncharacterized protein n=1 Tax=Chitinophaga agri TaxID=2703787 RepID=A0A6B9ZGC5_9BACT|nr:hypothetical protein [Chitinophaga agri]QHS61167.1 hypothetical protein GWR21_16650 [Chitinophaga agri]
MVPSSNRFFKKCQLKAENKMMKADEKNNAVITKRNTDLLKQMEAMENQNAYMYVNQNYPFNVPVPTNEEKELKSKRLFLWAEITLLTQIKNNGPFTGDDNAIQSLSEAQKAALNFAEHVKNDPRQIEDQIKTLEKQLYSLI